MDDYFLIYDYFPVIRLSDGNYPMYMPQVRKENSNISFPIPIRDYILEEYGYAPVFDSEEPQYDPNTQHLVEGAPVENQTDEKWYKTWTVVDYTAEELATNLQNAKESLLSMASGVLSNDLYSGVEFTFNSETHIADVAAGKLSLLLSVQSLAQAADDNDTFPYGFMGGEYVVFTKAEFLTMAKSVIESVYEINKNFWQFKEDVSSKTLIADIPALPDTFKPASFQI